MIDDTQENQHASASQADIVDEGATGAEGNGAAQQQPVSTVQADDAVSASQSASVDKPADQQSNAATHDDHFAHVKEFLRHAEAALEHLEAAAAHAVNEFDKIVISDAKAIIGKLKAFRDHAPHLFKA